MEIWKRNIPDVLLSNILLFVLLNFVSSRCSKYSWAYLRDQICGTWRDDEDSKNSKCEPWCISGVAIFLESAGPLLISRDKTSRWVILLGADDERSLWEKWYDSLETYKRIFLFKSLLQEAKTGIVLDVRTDELILHFVNVPALKS